MSEKYDTSTWDGGAVEAALDVSDFRKVCLLDLNGYEGQEGEPTKALCKLPYKTSPDAKPNLSAIRAIAGGHGIGAVKRPDGVPEEFYNGKLTTAKAKFEKMREAAFDSKVEQVIEMVRILTETIEQIKASVEDTQKDVEEIKLYG